MKHVHSTQRRISDTYLFYFWEQLNFCSTIVALTVEVADLDGDIRALIFIPTVSVSSSYTENSADTGTDKISHKPQTTSWEGTSSSCPSEGDSDDEELMIQAKMKCYLL